VPGVRDCSVRVCGSPRLVHRQNRRRRQSYADCPPLAVDCTPTEGDLYSCSVPLLSHERELSRGSVRCAHVCPAGRFFPCAMRTLQTLRECHLSLSLPTSDCHRDDKKYGYSAGKLRFRHLGDGGFLARAGRSPYCECRSWGKRKGRY